MRSVTRVALAAAAVAALVGAALPTPATATHNGGHATPCDQPGTVGGGALGNSPGPVGPPNSLGWDVGSGQCNGSFSITTDGAFPGGALELGLRAEERRIGQLAPSGPNDYTVQTGADLGPPINANRAWWNFQGSIAYGGSINTLDSLTLAIQTDVGPNLPAAPVVDLLALRAFIDARNNQPNATTGFADLYQISQNPEFGWFAPTSDTDANPTGAFDYDQPGAWRFTITATEAGVSSSVSVCIHTPGQACIPPNADPDCSAAAASLAGLWPPNHQMVPIAVTGVTDPDGDPISITIDSIFQDEPVNATGDGTTGPDGAGVGTATAEVRAERSGSKKNGGNGRVYTIGYTAADGQGGSCTGVVTVGVPHDKKSVAVDDGPVYDSTI
ncbi:MAG: hypothetical protein HKN44_06715 [Ilumatobacter sp.]|nr:hypothetical protein [Ilumatobacter sp.]